MVHLDVQPNLVDAVRKGRKSIPVARKDWRRFAGLPWGSMIHLRAKGVSIYVASGPVRFSDGWYLPVIGGIKPSEDAAHIRSRVEQFRQRYRLEA
jgi:hypothetical protein